MGISRAFLGQNAPDLCPLQVDHFTLVSTAISIRTRSPPRQQLVTEQTLVTAASASCELRLRGISTWRLRECSPWLNGARFDSEVSSSISPTHQTLVCQ